MGTGSTAQAQDESWSRLMRAAQGGDRLAYELLLREVTPFIRALARRHCRIHGDIEEAVQETLLTVHRVRATYDPRRPFTPWLAAIASRRAIDGLRRRLRVSRHETSEAGAYETFADDAANNDVETMYAGEELSLLMRQLPPGQRQALESLKLREMSLAEASAESGQSIAALKVNAHRALKALRALFQEQKE